MSINAMNTGKTAVYLTSELDKYIPFNRHWVWAYYLYFPFILLPILFLRDSRELFQAFIFYCITAGITLTIFALWRTGMYRPEIAADDLSARLLKGIYAKDYPYNCFPSQHVAYSFTATLVFFRRKRLYGWLALVIALLISMSTLFIKQHWFIDVPAGILVAFLAYLITYKMIFGDKIDHET